MARNEASGGVHGIRRIDWVPAVAHYPNTRSSRQRLAPPSLSATIARQQGGHKKPRTEAEPPVNTPKAATLRSVIPLVHPSAPPKKRRVSRPPPSLKLAPLPTPTTGYHDVHFPQPPCFEPSVAAEPSGPFFPLALLPEAPQDLVPSIDHLDVLELVDFLEYQLQSPRSVRELHEVAVVASTCLVDLPPVPILRASPPPPPPSPATPTGCPTPAALTPPPSGGDLVVSPTGRAELKLWPRPVV
ncbi:hypothetical protein JCM10449v2_005994 [Rhodotorula kratochvilovae]